MSLRAVLLTSFLLWAACASVQAATVIKKKLPDGRRITVAEGPAEPRSIGSFSLRLYSGVNPKGPQDDFLGGRIDERDGFLESVEMIDLIGDKVPELIVVLRNVGTSSSLDLHVYQINKSGFELVRSFASLDKAIRPAQFLQEQFPLESR